MNQKELKTAPINAMSLPLHKRYSLYNELEERQSVLSHRSKNESTKSKIDKKEVIDIINKANEFIKNLKLKS